MRPPSSSIAATTALVALLLAACAAREAGPEIRLGPEAHPTDLGCPRNSNCVSSLGGGGLPALRYAGNAEQGMALLRATLASHPEATIVRSDPVWLEVIFTTTLGFRDQVDFVLDAKTGRINFRSQSLLGHYDFGKNRSRMTSFSERFEAMAKAK